MHLSHMPQYTTLEQKSAYVFLPMWCIVGYGKGVLWDLCDWPILAPLIRRHYSKYRTRPFDWIPTFLWHWWTLHDVTNHQQQIWTCLINGHLRFPAKIAWYLSQWDHKRPLRPRNRFPRACLEDAHVHVYQRPVGKHPWGPVAFKQKYIYWKFFRY